MFCAEDRGSGEIVSGAYLEGARVPCKFLKSGLYAWVFGKKVAHLGMQTHD
mgnify:CR=1 FL=1